MPSLTGLQTTYRNLSTISRSTAQYLEADSQWMGLHKYLLTFELTTGISTHSPTVISMGKAGGNPEDLGWGVMIKS